jgi:asparagine synthase (glutamine-hydrolysing)
VGFPDAGRRPARLLAAPAPDYKLKGLKLRWFFKEALRGFLPDEIITKKKQGFGLPFGVWASQHPACRRWPTDSLQLAGHARHRAPDFIATLLSTTCPRTRATTARWCGS